MKYLNELSKNNTFKFSIYKIVYLENNKYFVQLLKYLYIQIYLKIYNYRLN